MSTSNTDNNPTPLEELATTMNALYSDSALNQLRGMHEQILGASLDLDARRHYEQSRHDYFLREVLGLPGLADANAKWFEVSEEILNAQECLFNLLRNLRACHDNRLDSPEAAKMVQDCLGQVRYHLRRRLELQDEADALDDIAEKELEATLASLQSGVKVASA